MKKQIITLVTILLTSIIFSQNGGFNYKAIITDNGNALSNQSIDVKFTILENGTTTVYQEVNTVTTDNNGIIILNIGEGTVMAGSFNGIDWTNENFLKTEIDTGSGFTNFGTTVFNYVPLSKNSDKLEGKTVADIKAELDTEKFNSILSRLDNLETQNTALQDQVNSLQSKLDYITVTQNVNLDNLENSVQNNTANIATNTHDLNDSDGRLSYFINWLSDRITPIETKTADMSIVNLNYEGQNYKTVRFNHVNVQIVNGSGYTNQRYSDNGILDGGGLGNLIIGYNEIATSGSYLNERTGYNNLIVGSINNYTSYGSVVFGKSNRSKSIYSTITGGYDNEVGKPYSSISGGADKSTPSSSSNSDWFYWIGDQYHSN